jgi:hypothetical protein
MKKPRSDRRGLPADYLQPLVSALADPAVLAGIRREELEPVTFQLALYFGLRRDPATASALGNVYERLLAEVTVEDRRALVDELAGAVRGGATSALAFVPVLQREREAGVARAAALALATTMPAAGEDALAGPRALRAMLDHTEHDGVRAGIVGALLALGDRRVRTLLDGAWRALPPEAARALLALPRDWCSRLEVDWLLDWMEDAEPGLFAELAGSLARLASAGEGRVLDLERELPAPAAAVGGTAADWLRILTDRGVREVGAELAPRLRDLGRRAAPGALEPVLRAWGVAS